MVSSSRLPIAQFSESLASYFFMMFSKGHVVNHARIQVISTSLPRKIVEIFCKKSKFPNKPLIMYFGSHDVGSL